MGEMSFGARVVLSALGGMVAGYSGSLALSAGLTAWGYVSMFIVYVVGLVVGLVVGFNGSAKESEDE